MTKKRTQAKSAERFQRAHLIRGDPGGSVTMNESREEYTKGEPAGLTIRVYQDSIEIQVTGPVRPVMRSKPAPEIPRTWDVLEIQHAPTKKKRKSKRRSKAA